MKTRDLQQKGAQNQSAAQQRKGTASLESPQGEQIAQLETMTEVSPQVDRLAQLAAIANDNPTATAQRRLIDGIHNSPRATTQRQQLDGLAGETAQREEAPAKPNNTGLPDNLKSGIESLSGISMDNVKVHYNSSQPAQLNAHAYAQGTDIHVAPGQEQHLPHEAWHVVQQAQGRVQPTMQMKDDVPINDDKSLEHEADVMGAKAAGRKRNLSALTMNTPSMGGTARTPVQLMWMYRVQDNDKEKKRVTIDAGNIEVGSGPLNVSAGYPDHALYFLGNGNPYETDVVEFELDDDVYYEIVENMLRQSGKKSKTSDNPTFNDITKPGFKIEIPDGQYLELFKSGLIQGTGRVTRGAEFMLREGPRMYNEKEVCDMAKAILEMYPTEKVVERQVKKLMVKENGLEYDGESFSNAGELDVDWKDVNDKLWVIFNNQVNKGLG